MYLLSNTYVAVFVIIAVGLFVGNIKIKNISLDTSAIIFVALIFGHFGVKLPPIIQKLGLIFFIYSVGIQAGPGFFDSFKKQGVNLIILTVMVVTSGALITVGCASILDIDFDLAVGLFTGALTSTPGLASAIDATKSPMASIGYGIAYPFGVLGIILFIKIIHRALKVDVKAEELKYQQEVEEDYPKLVNKNFIIENPNIEGKTIGSLNIRAMTGANISRIFHDGVTKTPDKKTILHKGDIIKAVGTEECLEKVNLLIGNPTEVKIPLTKKFVVRSLLVTNKKIVNKSFAEIGLFTNFNATATSIRRSGIDITPTSKSRLRFGDKVMIACGEEDLSAVSEFFGDNKKSLDQVDFLAISVGILIGILVGYIEIPLGFFNFKLGLTGGILLSSLILSKIGRTGNIIWNVSGTSNQLLRKLGLILFLASVGTNAGGSLVATVSQYGIQLFAVGALITLIPMFLAIGLGHFFFKINFLTLIGALTGGMTSTPALSTIDEITEIDAPKIAYATVYPFALVTLVICSQVIGLL